MEKTSQNQIATQRTDFLIEEYNQCFSHMRHYDELKLSLAKFAFSFYSAIATVSFALERYFYYELKTRSVDVFLGLLLVITFLVGLLILVMMVRYRKYFVLVARQVNGIRRYFFAEINHAGEKVQNALHSYTDPEKPIAYNKKSTYLLLAYLFSLINSIALVFACFFILRYFDFLASHPSVSVIILFVLFIISLLSELLYLREQLKESKI
jgi:hypothetical protein